MTRREPRKQRAIDPADGAASGTDDAILHLALRAVVRLRPKNSAARLRILWMHRFQPGFRMFAQLLARAPPYFFIGRASMYSTPTRIHRVRVEHLANVFRELAEAFLAGAAIVRRLRMVSVTSRKSPDAPVILPLEVNQR